MNAAATSRPALLLGALIALAVLAWQLVDVLLLGFAAILFAIILRSLAVPVERLTPIAAPWSLALSMLLLTATSAALMFVLGAQIHAQATQLLDRLPELVTALGDRLGVADLHERLVDEVEQFSKRSGIVGKLAGYTTGFIAALANVVLVAMAGIYLAVRPDRYRHGLLLLMPRRYRPRAASTLEHAGRALRLWLLGQLVSMAVIGVLTTAGLYALGMPSALALGFLAGMFAFVPVVGPVLSAVPAILVAVSEGGTMLAWVLGLYILVQQIEGNLIIPLVHRRTVELPPVLTLFAILAFGVLFGPLGILLGTPLLVVVYVAVRELYVRDVLNEPIEVPGERP